MPKVRFGSSVEQVLRNCGARHEHIKHFASVIRENSPGRMQATLVVATTENGSDRAMRQGRVHYRAL